MSMPLIALSVAVLLYLLSAGLLVRGVRRGERGTGWVALAVLAMLFHAEVHVEAWRVANGPDMHFFAALSLVALGMAALTTAFGLSGRMAALGVLVFPLAAVLAIAYQSYGHPQPAALGWKLQLHAWLALLAYATLSIAALLAVLTWLQDRALRQRNWHGWLRALPPLVELETLLFRTIGIGFVLLSGTLLTGVLFVDNLLDQHLAHKTVFSVLSWLAFGMLLVGRRRYGWRGPRAVAWTLSAMTLLVLAFFGSKFVLELLLQRG